MIKYIAHPVKLINGKPEASEFSAADREKTMAYRIMRSHDKSDSSDRFRISVDALISHDITYVGIIQTARFSGMKEFPLPYAMTNCHNSLCAVGGTINEDDHVFGLSAARKYGGIYVPANQSVIHSFAREELSGCGKMIMGSDSHTRYGALGTMGIGEGGPELVKQLLKDTYDIKAPEVVLCYVTGKVKHGVGPHDVALSLVKETFKQGLVKNKILEFYGPGIADLSVDFRCGVDVMTTETTCLSSIWSTDCKVKDYYNVHGRPECYKEIKPEDGACYDSMIEIDLSSQESMIAVPFHPSNAYTIGEFRDNAMDILSEVENEAFRTIKVKCNLVSKVRKDGVYADQGIIAGCAGGSYENTVAAADILRGKSVGNGYYSLNVYPTSVPVSMALTKEGFSSDLLAAGAVIKPSFCGPCFGAGDVPSNNGFSIRHTTRNFPNREGAKPGEGQLAAVALMDARSIAATSANGGRITAATEIEYSDTPTEYRYDSSIYRKRCYFGFGNAKPEEDLVLGPNITDWPKMVPLCDNLVIELATVIRDPVTTTDELIPSGETSSYRSNPLRLAEFALSRRDPQYVGNAKKTFEVEQARRDGKTDDKIASVLKAAGVAVNSASDYEIGSAVFANCPGDGSAREQAASCQRVLGGIANICYEYATKRYRSNCINWGMIPFTIDRSEPFQYEQGDFVVVQDIRNAVSSGKSEIPATVVRKNGSVSSLKLNLTGLTEDEKRIILDGCLMNFCANRSK